MMLTSFGRAVLITAVSTILATIVSVSVIYVTDLLLTDFTARFDNYAFATGIPIGVAPLLIFPLVFLNYRMERAQAALARMARTDVLTGVANRRGFFEQAESAFGAHNESLAILMVDIDRFKEVNDRYGHAAGDELLKRMAAMIEETVSETANGVVGRIGGEEFSVLLRGADRGAAALLAERLCVRARYTLKPDSGQAIGATLSIGVAVRSADEDVDAVMKAADMAVYEAKRSGRDRWALAGGACHKDDAGKPVETPKAA